MDKEPELLYSDSISTLSNLSSNGQIRYTYDEEKLKSVLKEL